MSLHPPSNAKTAPPGAWYLVSKWAWERRLGSRNCDSFVSLRARNLAASLESDFFSLPTYKPLPSSTASSLKYLSHATPPLCWHIPALPQVGLPASSCLDHHPSFLTALPLLSTTQTSNELLQNSHPATLEQESGQPL
jgi:hypothetical protein